MSAYLYYELEAIKQELQEIQRGQIEYRRVHICAKLVGCAIVVLMDQYGFNASTIIITWFFIVNPISYVLEILFRYKHRHNLL